MLVFNSLRCSVSACTEYISMCSARFSRLLLLHLEAARGKDVTSACFSTANVLTSCHPPQRALPGRLQFSSGCTKHHLFHIQSVGGTVSASEDPYRAARTSSSVTQASIWDTSASRRSRVVHEIDIMHRIQLHGVAAGSACTFGHASGMGRRGQLWWEEMACCPCREAISLCASRHRERALSTV